MGEGEWSVGDGRRGSGPSRTPAPTGGCGKPHQPPKPADAQRSACVSGRKEQVRIGARTIKRGTGDADCHVASLLAMTGGETGRLPRMPGERLAKRKARKEELVKFGFCPMTELFSTG